MVEDSLLDGKRGTDGDHVSGISAGQKDDASLKGLFDDTLRTCGVSKLESNKQSAPSDFGDVG